MCPLFAWVTAWHPLIIDIAYFRRCFRLISAINSVGLKKKHHHAVVRVHGLAQHRHAHSGLRADQSRTSEVVVLEHLKTRLCCRRALFCISSVPLFLYVRLGSRNVTYINPKNDFRYVPRNALFHKISNSAQCGLFALILWRLVKGSFFCVF